MKKKTIEEFDAALLNEVICGGEKQHTTYSGPNDTLGDDMWDGCVMTYF